MPVQLGTANSGAPGNADRAAVTKGSPRVATDVIPVGGSAVSRCDILNFKSTREQDLAGQIRKSCLAARDAFRCLLDQ